MSMVFRACEWYMDGMDGVDGTVLVRVCANEKSEKWEREERKLDREGD